MSTVGLVKPQNLNGSMLCTDRTKLLPRHNGPLVFPNSPLFSKLLRHAYRRRLAIRDLRSGAQKTYGELLSDVLSLRAVVEASLDSATLERLQRGDEVFIGVLAPGGYEYAVAFLAVIALGAAAVPMSVMHPVHEAEYFVEKSKQVAILSASASKTLGDSIAKSLNDRCAGNIICIDVLSNLPLTHIPYTDMRISSDTYLDDNAAGIVIFTSGTTGLPKGVVLRRAYVHDAAVSVADFYDVSHKDVILHILPVHHATGIVISFLPFLISGACIEFCSGNFVPALIWERWKKGGLTFFSGVPTIYMRMMRHFEHHIASLPKGEQSLYIEGANRFRTMLCGSSALPRPMQDFWTNIRNGNAILTRYGATEFGAVIKAEPDNRRTPNGSVGKIFTGCDIRLSGGDEGEILVKSPHMFSKYLYDDEATARAHDEEGYFKTGDIGRREGDYYWIVGRASLDIIKSGGYKISALDIEREILGLPYISEAMVCGVDDDEFGQRVAAVVTLRDDQSTYSTNGIGQRLLLDGLRKDLRGHLAGYKLPTLLRVLDGELPKGQSGKVLKKIFGPKLFPSPGWENDLEVQAWSSKKPEVLARL